LICKILNRFLLQTLNDSIIAAMRQPKIQLLEDASDVSLVGGKAASLGYLARNGFKTLSGFVVTTAAFNRLDGNLEQEIIDAFDRLGSKYVAVRSSAAAEDGKNDAWAGQLDTFLNVGREELIMTIKKSWNAINSDRAKAYAEAKKVQAGKVALIVQPMIQSDVAGVAFSAHPVTKNKNEIIIEAGMGLGEAVVSGEITPDTYIINKKSGEIMHKHISNQNKKLVQGKSGKSVWQEVRNNNQQKLSNLQIKELAKIVARLENLYGFAVDVEWLVKDGVLFIMQARPITTLG
jgi:phosphoenolpyruvate synthase/pyruvate phosphate dikinase